MGTGKDWEKWHGNYAHADSPLVTRLLTVQEQIRAVLGADPPDPLRVLSICAGDSRDLLGVLAEQPPPCGVQGRLVEIDARLVESAAASAAELDLDLSGLEIVCGDASSTDAYLGAVPADLVLVCGVFGNISDDDVEHTVGILPQLCAPGARVIWTRSRRDPDLTPRIRSWFETAGFAEVAFIAPADELHAVAVHRYDGPTPPLVPGVTMFSFVAPTRTVPQPTALGRVKSLLRSVGSRPTGSSNR